jgi:predicted TIM-barrel enzyme
LRYLSRLRADGIRVFADAHVKNGAHALVQDRPLRSWCATSSFSAQMSSFQLSSVRVKPPISATFDRSAGATSVPTLVGSGVTTSNAKAILDIVDGVIVASSLKVDGVWWNPVNPIRANAFVAKLRV